MEGQHFGHSLGLAVTKGAWSAHEDLLLTRYINEHGQGNWHLIPKRAGLNRCRKSCRLRWLNYLSPHIKRGRFADDEIDLIARLHRLLGNRWSLIAGRIPGRTANDVKIFWNIHMKKTCQLNYSHKNVDTLPKFDTSSKVEVIKPRARSFSKNSFFLKENFVRIETQENIIHNKSDKTKEIIDPNQSKTTQPEHEHHDNNSFLFYLKSPLCEMDANTSGKEVEQGHDYWRQYYLSTSHDNSVLNTTLELDLDDSGSLPQLNTGWSDLLWENVDIWSLI